MSKVIKRENANVIDYKTLSENFLADKVELSTILSMKDIDREKLLATVKEVQKEIHEKRMREEEKAREEDKFKLELQALKEGKAIERPQEDAIALALRCGIVSQTGDKYTLTKGKLVSLYEVGCKVLGYGNPRSNNLCSATHTKALTAWTQSFLKAIGNEDRVTFKQRQSAIASHMNSSFKGLNKGAGRDTLIFVSL